MIQLFQGGGAGDFELFGPVFNNEQLGRIRNLACQMLARQGNSVSSDFFKNIPFEIYEATNKFGDQFSIVHASVPFDQYMQINESKDQDKLSGIGYQIAKTIEEISGKYIRFVVVELDTEAGLNPVDTPVIQYSSNAIEQALDDAKQLVLSGKPNNAVDRTHTALHGYLQKKCKLLDIKYESTDTIARLFKLIRNHPIFSKNSVNDKEINKINNSIGAILDALNTIRNEKSLAHPNDLLGKPEAMLAINCSLSILHYLESKIG
jgi:hypothetical protein